MFFRGDLHDDFERFNPDGPPNNHLFGELFIDDVFQIADVPEFVERNNGHVDIGNAPEFQELNVIEREVHREDQVLHDVEEDEDNPFLSIKDYDLIMPLLADENLTSRDHLLALLAITVRHKLDYECLLSNLKWAKIILLHSDLPSCKTTLWKALSRDDSNIVRHLYCRYCKKVIGQPNNIQFECPCGRCGPEKENSEISYFLQIKIRPQIKELLKNEDFVQALDYRDQRTKRNEDAIEDTQDGNSHKQKCLPGNFLSVKHNYDFRMNTDGLSVSESSKCSCWAQFLVWNGLPPHLRKKYSILAGVWVDTSHPIMNEFFKPFVDEMRDLYNRGVTWTRNGEEITSRFIVNIVSVDTRARAPLLNMLQPNGRVSCTFCYYAGETATAKNSLHRVYPSHEAHRLRTDAEMRNDMMRGTPSEPVNGIMGPSCLAALPEFDLGTGE